jgi:hypothetical protein
MSLFQRSSRKWRGVDFMSLVPQKACGWDESSEPGNVVVLQPRYGSGLLGRFIQPRLKESKKYVRIPLEERGSFLWLTMDGQKTVGDLATSFFQEFELEAESVPERVSTYLYQMVENKLVKFLNLNI